MPDGVAFVPGASRGLGGPTPTVDGKEAADQLSPRGRSLLDALTTLGARAAARFNE